MKDPNLQSTGGNAEPLNAPPIITEVAPEVSDAIAAISNDTLAEIAQQELPVAGEKVGIVDAA